MVFTRSQSAKLERRAAQERQRQQEKQTQPAQHQQEEVPGSEGQDAEEGESKSPLEESMLSLDPGDQLEVINGVQHAAPSSFEDDSLEDYHVIAAILWFFDVLSWLKTPTII